jgi:hypothetical protein
MTLALMTLNWHSSEPCIKPLQNPTRTVGTNAEAGALRSRCNQTLACGTAWRGGRQGRQEKSLSQMAPQAPRHAVPKKQRFNFKWTKEEELS